MTYTAEQIRNMPAGPELDRAAAEIIMGWGVHHRNTSLYCVAGQESDALRESMGFIDNWRPSTHIKDAWRLVDVKDFYISGIGNYYSVRIYRADYAVKRIPPVEGNGSTAPLAITRAAILAKMGES
jgi:hypothetical protein